MFAHPWKAHDLTVRMWFEPDEVYVNYDEANDADWDVLYDDNDLCPYCFLPSACRPMDGWPEVQCDCYEWDDDCWIGATRPWTCRSPYLEERMANAPRLSTKGKLQQREYHRHHIAYTTGLAERRKIRRARRRWMVLKNLVDARRVALYWQEQTQRRLCAADGEGRAADAAAFRAEF